MDAEQALRDTRLLLARLEGRREALVASVASERERASALSTEIERLGKVLWLFHQMSGDVHETFLAGVEKLVSEGVSAVFGEVITFKIVPVVRGKAVNLDFVLEGSGGSQSDLLASRGGGLVAVVGLILRIVTVRLLAASQRQVLLLDEPLAMLSAEFVPACGELLKSLAEQLDIQLIMVTHQPEFAEYADTTYRLTRGAHGTEVHAE